MVSQPSGSPRPTGRLDLSLRTTGTFSDWGDDSTPANSRPVSPSRLGPPGFLANTLTPPPTTGDFLLSTGSRVLHESSQLPSALSFQPDDISANSPASRPLSPAARRITAEMKAARERRANGEPEPGEPDDGAAPEPEAPVVDDGGVDESAPAEEE